MLAFGRPSGTQPSPTLVVLHDSVELRRHSQSSWKGQTSPTSLTFIAKNCFVKRAVRFSSLATAIGPRATAVLELPVCHQRSQPSADRDGPMGKPYLPSPARAEAAKIACDACAGVNEPSNIARSARSLFVAQTKTRTSWLAFSTDDWRQLMR